MNFKVPSSLKHCMTVLNYRNVYLQNYRNYRNVIKLSAHFAQQTSVARPRWDSSCRSMRLPDLTPGPATPLWGMALGGKKSPLAQPGLQQPVNVGETELIRGTITWSTTTTKLSSPQRTTGLVRYMQDGNHGSLFPLKEKRHLRQCQRNTIQDNC